jgi:Tol biopolymer transport system component
LTARRTESYDQPDRGPRHRRHTASRPEVFRRCSRHAARLRVAGRRTLSSQAGAAQLAFETNRTGDGDIAVATEPNGGRLVTTAGSEEIQPAVAPNGRIAFASDRRDDNYDIFVTDPGGQGEPTHVTKNKASDYSPAWAPGGGLLAFVTERNGNPDIYVIEGGARLSQLEERRPQNG